MSRETIIGIDPGLGTTGWAVVWPGVCPSAICGSWTTSTDDGNNRARIKEIGFRFVKLLCSYAPSLVCVEGYVFQGRAQSFQGSSTPRVLERILACADFHGVAAVEVTPSAAKKRCGIRGKPSHGDIVKAFPGIQERTNEHGRDAVVIALGGWIGANETRGPGLVLPTRAKPSNLRDGKGA